MTKTEICVQCAQVDLDIEQGQVLITTDPARAKQIFWRIACALAKVRDKGVSQIGDELEKELVKQGRGIPAIISVSKTDEHGAAPCALA